MSDVKLEELEELKDYEVEYNPNVRLQEFTLSKIKTQDVGLQIQFDVKRSFGDQVFYDDNSKKSTKVPHPDLVSVLERFKPLLTTVFYYENDMLDKIRVTGVSISGQDINRGLIITGKLKTETGQYVAINSQRLKYSGTKYGFEDELEGIVKDLEKEAYMYSFENKKAQLEVFTDQV